MTRDEAVQIAILGSSRLMHSLRQERPQGLCDRLEIEAAEDSVDLLVAFGLIKIDPSDDVSAATERNDG
jgi:hypothetical protein